MALMRDVARARYSRRSPTFEPSATKARRGSGCATDQYESMAWATPATSWTRRMRAPFSTAAMQTPAVAASRLATSCTPETAPTRGLRDTAHMTG